MYDTPKPEFNIGDKVDVKRGRREPIRELYNEFARKVTGDALGVDPDDVELTIDQLATIEQKMTLINGTGTVIGIEPFGLPTATVCHRCYLVRSNTYSGIQYWYHVQFERKEFVFVRKFQGHALVRREKETAR